MTTFTLGKTVVEVRRLGTWTPRQEPTPTPEPTPLLTEDLKALALIAGAEAANIVSASLGRQGVEVSRSQSVNLRWLAPLVRPPRGSSGRLRLTCTMEARIDRGDSTEIQTGSYEHAGPVEWWPRAQTAEELRARQRSLHGRAWRRLRRR